MVNNQNSGWLSGQTTAYIERITRMFKLTSMALWHPTNIDCTATTQYTPFDSSPN